MGVFSSYLTGDLRRKVDDAPKTPMDMYAGRRQDSRTTDSDRDIAIRTMLGEASGEGPEGMAAVAHVLFNRKKAGRWGDSIKDVALQPYQFSAWNKGEGGNSLVNKYGPDSEEYQRAARLYDLVSAGVIPDPTGGATHYYAHNTIDAPDWWGNLSAGPVIGGHSFAK